MDSAYGASAPRRGGAGFTGAAPVSTLRSRCVKAIRRFTIHPVLPEPLEPLRGLMLNLRWSWDEPTRQLFAAIDPGNRELGEQDPAALLAQLTQNRLVALAAGPDFMNRLAATTEDLAQYLTGPRWYQGETVAASMGEMPAAIAYFS